MARVAFCQHLFYEYLGPMVLSAQLKKHGHETEIFISDIKLLLEAVKRNEFDLVCFSMMTCDVEWGVQYAKAIKEVNNAVPIIAGGAHPTFSPGFLDENNCFDMVCIGEGDTIILDLADAISNGRPYTNINNLVVRDGHGKVVSNPLSPLVQDLDSLPFPDRQLYRKYPYFNNYPITSMIASRGCPYLCSFCFNHQYNVLYETNKFRLRSHENIIAEIKHIESLGRKTNMLFFVDSTFNLDLAWCESFFRKYKEQVKLPFSLNIVAGRLNEQVVDAIAETGLCHTIRFAVESGNEAIRRDVLKKPISNKKIIESVRLLRARNITTYIYLMFGLPFETAENAMETIRISQEIKPDFINSALFMPYRNLDITKLALQNGFLKEDDLRLLDDPKYTRLESVLRLKDIDRIRNIFFFSLVMIHFPFTERVLMLLAKMRPNIIFKGIFLISYFLQTKKFVGIGWIRSIKESFYHKAEK